MNDIREREGNLEDDVPLRIITAKQYDERQTEIICKIEWEEKHGEKPLPSWYTNTEMKQHYPLLLCNFYEEKLKFPRTEK